MTLNYLNSASHGFPDRAVLERMSAHLDLEARVGPLAAREQVDDALKSVTEDALTLLNSQAECLGFSTGTLNALSTYVYGLSISGKRLLVAPHEWGENITFLQNLAARFDASVEVLPLFDLASPDLSTWQDRIDDDVAAIFVPMVTSVAGLHYPVEAIGQLERPAHAEFIVDAAQAIGQVEIDVERLGCTALFATTRKWVRGPRQTAVFWTANSQRRADVEHNDTNVALRLGLGVAFGQLLERGVAQTAAELRERSTHIRARADALGLGYLSTAETGTAAVTILLPNQSFEQVSNALEAAEIVAKWPNALADEPTSEVDVESSKPLRVAPHITTPIADIDAAFDVISAAL